jgi:hypothetical protein
MSHFVCSKKFTQTKQAEHQSHDNPMHGQIVTQNAQNPSKIPNMRVTSVFKDKYLHSIHSCACLACRQTSQAFGNFNRHTILNTENHSRTCVLPTTCFPKATVNMSEVSVFSQFKAKFYADMLFFQVYQNKVNQNCKLNNTLILNKTLLNNPINCSFILSRK